jgi:hypothetical protein
MRKLCLLFVSLVYAIISPAQNVGIGTKTPHPSASLEVSGTSKGLLIPRLTTAQRNLIASPAAGLMIYNTDCNVFNYWNGSAWLPFPGNANAPATPGSISGNISPCLGSSGVPYSTNLVPGASSYNWTVPADAIVASGQGTANVTINFGTSNGDICVTASNACGTSSPICSAVTMLTSIAQAGVITGNAAVCQASNDVAYSVANVPGIGYTWSYSGTGFSQSSGGNTNSITANFSATATSGILSVTPVNSCGIGAAQTFAVAVTALPIATFSYTAGAYCSTAANPSPAFSGGGVAGTFSSTPGLVFVSAATGQVNIAASTAGTYTVTNTLPATGVCGMVTATCNITITTLPVATFSYTGTPYCKDAAYAYPTFSGAGVAGMFSSAPDIAFTNTATGQIFLLASTAGSYTVTNTIAASGGCPVVTATSGIQIFSIPDIANAGADIHTACGVTTATLSGNTPVTGTGTWSLISGTASITNTTSPVSGVTGLLAGGTATLRWTISNGPCTASTDDVLIISPCCTSPSITAGSTIVGTSSACKGTGSSNTITLNKPSGVSSGNVLIAAINEDNFAVTPPAGWILIASYDTWAPSHVYYKIAGSSEPANYTWTFNGSVYASGLITNFTGSLCSSPIGASSVTPTAVYTALSVNTTLPGQMLVAIYASGSAADTWNSPAGMAAGYSGGQSCGATSIFYGVQPTAGASGPKTATPLNVANPSTGVAYLIVLQ